jgi:hypothetical protein
MGLERFMYATLRVNTDGAAGLGAMISQHVVEALVAPSPVAKVSQHVIEVLMSEDGNTGPGAQGPKSVYLLGSRF